MTVPGAPARPGWQEAFASGGADAAMAGWCQASGSWAPCSADTACRSCGHTLDGHWALTGPLREGDTFGCCHCGCRHFSCAHGAA